MIASGGSGIPSEVMYGQSQSTSRHVPPRTPGHGQGHRGDNREDHSGNCGMENMMKKLEELVQASTQQQSFLFSLQEEVQGLGCQVGDLKGTVDALQDRVLELQETTTSDSSENFSASCRIPKDVSVSTLAVYFQTSSSIIIATVFLTDFFMGQSKISSFKPN